MTSYDDLIAMWDEAAGTPDGPTANQLWAQLAVQAEEAGERHIALNANLTLCQKYSRTERPEKVLVAFVWCVNAYRDEPELFGERELYLYGWMFKHVLAAVERIPRISRQQCLDIIEDMRLFYLQAGESLRPYYSLAQSLHTAFGEEEAAEHFYEQWKDAPVTDLSDCTACDPENEIGHEVDRGNWEAAASAGDAALAAGGRQCDKQPNSILSLLLEPWLRTGRDAEAWAAHLRVYRDYQTRIEKIGDLYHHLDYLYLTGRAERLERARRILIRHLPWWPDARSPWSLMYLACAAANIVGALPGDHDTEVLPATLPGGKIDMDLPPRPTLTNPTLTQARQWFVSLAHDIAWQFDHRPGVETSHARDVVERRLAARPLEANSDGIADVAGLLREDATDYRLAGGAGSSGVGESGGAGSSSTGSAGAPAGESGTEAPAQPAVVPVDIDGHWRTMDGAELEAMAVRIGPRRGSVYSWELRERIADGRQKTLPSGELGDHLHGRLAQMVGQDRLAELGLASADHPGSSNPAASGPAACGSSEQALTAPPASDAGVKPDAWDKIERAGKLMREDRPAEAALAADEATRTASEDSLGVRIAALGVLGHASLNAGFHVEGVAYARQALNLCAAAGFNLAAAEFAYMLSMHLVSMRRYLETAEVAQLGVAYLEDRTSSSPLLELLLENMLAGLDGIKDERGAADVAIRLGDLRELAGDERAACLHHWEAARLLRSSDNHARALATWAHVVRLAEATGDTKLLTGALWNQADTLAFSPGRINDEEFAHLESLLARLHGLGIDAVGPAPSGRPEDESEWNALRTEAEWCVRAARLHWAAQRHRTALDIQEAAVEGLERLGTEAEVDHVEQLIVLANMHRMNGAIETALDRGASAGRLLEDDSFQGHRLRRMHRNLMQLIEDDAAQ
ncbi:MAG: hypothetical protein Q3979_03370 [Actinomycetaceae bacterium]|nr:hypothetical protein [Actinomycetaceae bacterium]